MLRWESCLPLGPRHRRPHRPSARAGHRARHPPTAPAAPLASAEPSLFRLASPARGASQLAERLRVSRWTSAAPTPAGTNATSSTSTFPTGFLLSQVQIIRRARSKSERTRREDRRLKLYEPRDNLTRLPRAARAGNGASLAADSAWGQSTFAVPVVSARPESFVAAISVVSWVVTLPSVLHGANRHVPGCLGRRHHVLRGDR